MTLTADIARRKPSLAMGVIGFLLVYAVLVLVLWSADSLPPVLTRIAAVLFVVAVVPFLVLAHEGGHYAVARLIGWRVVLFTWGGYTIRLKPWRIRHGAPPFADASGAVVAVPARESRWGYIAVFAGGPGANLVIAFLSAAAALNVAGEFSAFFWLQAALSLIAGITNLSPWRRGSDGAQIVRLFYERDLAPRTLMARLVGQMIEEVRPRDWPPALMQAVIRLTLWTPYPSFLLLLYLWRMDRGEIAAAREVLERAGAGFEALLERAFFAAFIDADADMARAFLAQSGAHPASLPYWRAVAALAVLEKDAAMAQEAIRKGRILAHREPYATVWEREVFGQLEQRQA